MSEMEPGVRLEILDPGYRDPGYWQRFQIQVMKAVRPHLAYRRRTQVTMGGVMVSWSRLILPATVAAAYAMNREKEVGSFERGKRADMVVLSHDPTTVDRDFIRDIAVEQTYIEGRLLYRR